MLFRTGMRTSILASLISALVALSCSGCSDKLTPPAPPEDSTVSTTAALLVEVPQGAKPPAPGAATASHLPYGAIQDFFFSQNGRTVVYSVRDYGYSYVSLNGKPGKVYKADVASVVLSPGGNHYAYAAPVGTLWRMVLDGVEGADYTQVKEAQFSPDGRHLAYSAQKDGSWGLVLDGAWYPGNSKQAQKHVFSGDSSRIAYLDRVGENYAGRLVLADLKLRGQKVIAEGVHDLVANADRSRVAAVVSAEGRQRVVTFAFRDPATLKAEPTYDSVTNLGFAADGVSVAYTAEKLHQSYLVLNGREELLGGDEIREPPVVRPDSKGAGMILAGRDGRPYLRECFIPERKAPIRYDGASFLTYSRDGVPAFAAASVAKKAWFVVVGGKEGPPFDRVVQPRFSPDGKHLVYRARKAGKRFVVLADRSGKTVRQYPSHEQVYEVHFTADGRSIAYGVKDGQRLSWQVEPL